MGILKKLKMSLQMFIVEAISIIALLAFIIFFFIKYGEISGDTVSLSNGTSIIEKNKLLVLPIVCVVIYILISFLLYFPKLWTTGDNSVMAVKLVDTLKLMISYTKLLFVSVFFYICSRIIAGLALAKWFIPVAVAIAVLIIAYFLTKFFVLNSTYQSIKKSELDKKNIDK